MPLHKSYSDVNKSASKRPQWQRSRSHPNPAPPKPALPVSTKTKSKLKAFQFDSKDSESAAESDSTVDFPKKDEADGSVPRKAPQSSPLLGDTPTAAAKVDQEDSPSERLLWSHDLDPHKLGFSPILFRHGRKRRARSSSPVSSPITKGTASAAGLKKPGQALGTPRGDPTTDLWGRYHISGADASPSGLTNPLLTELMVSSSPRPSKDGSAPGSGRPLRKAVSLGSNWPKKRKLGRSEETEDASRTSALSQSKSSMVSAILKTVDGELSRSFEVQVPKLSPGRSQTVENSASRSPSRDPPPSSPLAQKLSRVAPDAAPARSKTSSDYGDDDFDDDTLMELAATILPAQDNPTLVFPAEETPHTKTETRPTDDDEFDDFDDDLFDGAEDLVTQIEAQHASQSQMPAQQQTQPVFDDGGGDDGDAYGDDFDDADFDDADFDAMELAATQAASLQSLPTHVRTIQ
ncbi:hypothetical protein B0T21DRAFT_131221 [Apiosordaria backusii]|uniref:Uncharacterized protein n=1 Tax=Apiosordaria backusii TaxID=314023 RepID=A0AA40ENC2_9PEZI|nr:hypothetical protein B0T21DRAFT_131221 [Apiosordaria backusii]